MRRPARRSCRPAIEAGIGLAALSFFGCARVDGADRKQTVHVAVASNFAAVHDDLVRLFEASSDYRVVASYGSTGKLYAQIREGAPFDVFLAADAERPRLLEDERRAAAGTRLVYATGRLALYAPGRDVATRGLDALRRDAFEHIALADPGLAPYGAAAREVLIGAGLWQALLPRMVRGENIAQALHFVESGGAELGFVALAQVQARPSAQVWIVPESLHAPIAQEAVLLATATGHAGARAYLQFLASDAARARIAQAGYDAAR